MSKISLTGDKINTGLLDFRSNPVLEGSIVRTAQSKNGNGRSPYHFITGIVTYENGSFYVVGKNDNKEEDRVSLSVFFNSYPFNKILVLKEEDILKAILPDALSMK